MRILQLIQKQQLRGAEVFAAQLSQHLVNAGHEVMIVSMCGGDVALPFSGSIISLDANFKNKFLDWKAWKKLASIINDFNPDIVQANAGDTLKYAVFSKKVFRWKKPIIFRNASMVSNYITNSFTKIFTGFLFNNVDHIIAVSQFTKNDLVNTFNKEANNITVLPVGIEITETNRLRAADPEQIDLVHIGGFSFEKNHERLLYMFKDLLSRDKRFRLWLVGDGPLKTKIQSLAQELNVADAIFFEGFKKNPLDYIFSSDILLLPSKIEGLPAVILEAFYCKTAVVAYNVGGISELVKNNETGWLVEPGDEKAFIASVISISESSKEDILPIINNAYTKVTSSFFNKQIAEKFAEIYKSQIRN